MNSKSILMAVGFTGIFAASAFADLRLTVESRQPARIYLNGQYSGEAPARYRRLEPGTWNVGVQSLRTGEFKQFTVHSPARHRKVETIEVNFRRPRVPVNYRPATYRPAPYRPAPYRPVYHRPVTVHPRPVVHEPTREYVRKRNTILALSAANEILNKNHGNRVEVRKGLLGAAVLNNLFNR